MKKLFVLFVFVICGNLLVAQTSKKATSGDVELDNSIKNITASARKDDDTFKKTLVAKYFITEAKAIEYYAQYTGGDLFMIFETAKETKKDVTDVFKTFNASRSTNKGWGETLKELGVKQDSKTFENIKIAVVNNGLN
ncbi:MAG TPA: hypothetical protein VJI69_03325 [Bacteroidia bacterium]|nr:hypothetical protein [Bacteroidia bacterium]